MSSTRQPKKLSPAQTNCQYCGAVVYTNSLSKHIARAHPQQKAETTPRLVKPKK